MRLSFLTTALALILAHPAAALAGALSSLSLRLDAGTGMPFEMGDPSRRLGLRGGASLGASLALNLGPALRATAGVRHDRPSSANELVTIAMVFPEAFLRSLEPVHLTAALVGLEVEAPMHSSPHSPDSRLFLGLSAGQAWLDGGDQLFDNRNGPSFTVPGVHESAPAIGADVGMRFPLGLPRLRAGVGWSGLFMRSRNHPMTISAVRLGVTL